MISIITPTYCSEKLIMDTYNSILKQTISDWEWIVTDDCSHDGTYQLLLEIEKSDKRVKVHQNSKNLGAAISRNVSINSASGEYLAFIDSDDMWHSTKLETQLAFMEKNKFNFSFTSYEVISQNSETSGVFVDSQTSMLSFSYEDMLRKKATLGCSTVMLKSSAFPKIEMPNLRTGQDYATWLSLLKTGENAHLLPQVLTQYRIVKGSISRNKFKKALRQWSIYRQVENLSLAKSFLCFSNYAFNAVFRK